VDTTTLRGRVLAGVPHGWEGSSWGFRLTKHQAGTNQIPQTTWALPGAVSGAAI